MNRRLVILVAGIAMVIAIVVGAFAMNREPKKLIEGEIEATQVDVSAKIPGRITSLRVREGDVVSKGSVIAILESDDIRAKLRQAEAAKAAAVAQSDKAQNGARRQEIAQAHDTWLRASAATELAEKTFGRLQRLERDGVIPAQRRDEAEAQWRIAREAERVAKSAYEMATEGARIEDKEAASALVERAAGAIDEVNSYAKEMQIVAPIGGEVSKTNADAGEMIAPGFPVITITNLEESWATFNVPEAQLQNFRIGSMIEARVPALDNRPHPLRVYYVSPAGDFATLRPSSASGGFDMKTFEVRARPIESGLAVRPGMSVLVETTR